MSKYIYILKRIILASFFDKKRVNNIDVLLFCSDADRGLNLESKAYSPLLDSVREDLEAQGFRCASVAYPFSKLTDDQAWGSPLSLDAFYYKIRISRLVRKWLLFGSNTNKNPFESIYDHLLTISKAKLVICIGIPAELSRVCRKKGIPSAELLHGMGFREVEWGWDKRKENDLPSYILSLDSISSTTFKSLSDRGINVLQIPHPFLKRFVISSYKLLLPKEWCVEHAQRSSVKKILFCLQWGYDGELTQFEGMLVNGLYPSCLDEIIADTNGQVDWLFRLHPVQITNPRYSSHLNLVTELCEKYSNAKWKESTEAPLPSVLESVDGCITMSSMSVYEAAYMGVPSLMLCPSVKDGGCYSDWYVDLIEAGFVEKNEATKDVLTRWIQRVTKKDPLISNIHDEDSWINAVKLMLDA